MNTKLIPTYRQLKPIQPIQPLRPLPMLPKLGQPPTMPIGQRTLPIAGAPRVPANPLLSLTAKFRNRK
jgi:hypothetical protein